MRIEKTVKETVVKNEIVRYIALDGTAFESQDECLKYEKTAKCVIKARYKALVKSIVPAIDIFIFDGCDYNYYHFVDVKSERDLLAVNMYVQSLNPSISDVMIPSTAIGNTIVLYFTEGNDEIFYFGTVDEYCNKIVADIRKAKDRNNADKYKL